jgi:hypothetical protein
MKISQLGVMAALFGADGLGGNAWGPALEEKRKPVRKCALPGCDIQTSHNGGYCCAEHCKEHVRLLKNRSIDIAY